MAKLFVCAVPSRAVAETARRRLLGRGFKDAQIHIVAAEDGGAPRVERMLSGVLSAGEVSRYAEAARAGKTVVALNVPDDAAAAEAASILDESGQPAGPPGAAADWSPAGAGGRGRVVDPTRTLSLPQVYPLPNSPTDWDETTLGEQSAIDVLTDPGRPAGAIEDAHGLGTDDTGDVFEARKAAARAKKKSKKTRSRK